jgi:hypothetical protein
MVPNQGDKSSIRSPVANAEAVAMLYRLIRNDSSASSIS